MCPQYKLNTNRLLCSIWLMISYEVLPCHTDICCVTILRLVTSLQARYQLQELKKLSSTDNKFKALRDATKRYRIYHVICVVTLKLLVYLVGILYHVYHTLAQCSMSCVYCSRYHQLTWSPQTTVRRWSISTKCDRYSRNMHT